MGLQDLTRKLVAVGDKLSGGFRVTVQHERWLGQGFEGDKQYAPPEDLAVIAIQKEGRVRGEEGQLVQFKHYLLALRPVVVSVRDKVTMPDGRSGPVVAWSGFVDSGTERPYFAEIYLGDPRF